MRFIIVGIISHIQLTMAVKVRNLTIKYWSLMSYILLPHTPSLIDEPILLICN